MRIRTGVIGFDRIIGGGYLPNTVNVVVGASGTGKTIFSLQYLMKGLEEGEKCFYISFDMDEKSVKRMAKSMGWDEIVEAIDSGELSITRSQADSISYLTEDILKFIQNHSEKAGRVVIDSFTPLISSLDYSVRKDISWFFDRLRNVGTSVVTVEEPFKGDLSKPDVALPIFLADSAIFMKNIGYGEAFSRTIQVIKHRASWHAEGVFPYRILPGLGIIVESDVEDFEIKEDLKSTVRNIKAEKSIKKRLNILAEKDVPVSKALIEKVLKLYETENK